ncbi:hypothetical protein L3Q82_026404 [Scortum barcoo]|uniref:Uncharacterized protein n=1 Tax=Scortum barcoo TaxID=214431 RepID=A0ACB8WI57_9TELE|nr:hypothetical protein L3Q82_026404 [Scortum barcoo]
MNEGRRQAFKTLLKLMSQLLWVVGLVVGLGGIRLLMKYRQNSIFFSDDHITLPAFLALACAVLLVLSGCLGTWVSLRDSTFLQGLFVFLLVLVFCLESTAWALAYFHSTELDSEIAPLGGLIQNYTDPSQDPKSKAVDAMQEKLQCCGVHDYRDWLETSWFYSKGGGLVPHSCCNSTFPFCKGSVNQPWQLYRQGCQMKMEMALQFVLTVVIWGFPLVCLVEV